MKNKPRAHSSTRLLSAPREKCSFHKLGCAGNVTVVSLSQSKLVSSPHPAEWLEIQHCLCLGLAPRAIPRSLDACTLKVTESI